MTLAFFAYVVMPALALVVAVTGYAVIVVTDPHRSPKPKAAGDQFDHPAQ